VNLKFIEDEEWDNRLHELSDRASSLAHTSPKWDPKAYKAATDELDEYGNIPELQITVTPIELDSGCAGTLIGELKTIYFLSFNFARTFEAGFSCGQRETRH
jgi:hypothetical protein